MSLSDLDLERAFIGEALRRYAFFAARGLTLEDFTDPRHQAVLQAAEAVQEAGEPVSLARVALELQRTGKAGLCGGERGLAELVLSARVPDPLRLRELRRLRAVQDAAYRGHTFALAGKLPEALTALADASQFGDPNQDRDVIAGLDLAQAVVETVHNKELRDRTQVYLGMRCLDNAIGKMPVGGLLVIAADTGVGKSSLALAMLVGMAKANVTCGLVSAEDPADVTAARLLGHFSRISGGQVQRGDYTGEFMSELNRGAEGVASLGRRFLFADCIGKGDLEVKAAMSRMAAQGARLICVDYLGEIQPSEKQQDRRNDMRHVAKQLKSHAKRVGVALVLVSQIARPKDESEFKCPSKHALKESGDITNMAEAIIGLWRESADDSVPVHARVLKCKWGGLGHSWKLQRDRETGRLHEGESW